MQLHTPDCRLAIILSSVLINPAINCTSEEMEVGTNAHAEWVAEVRARARHESSE